MQRFPFLEFTLTDTGVNGLIRWLVEPDPAVVEPRAAGYLNAHTVNLGLRRGSRLGPALKALDLLYPDGMSVVRSARSKGFPASERVSAADFFLRFCWAAAARNRSLALVGGSPGLANRCAGHLEEIVPGLRIPFSHHGYLPKDSVERAAVAERLAESNPGIVLLGMGSPAQEEFAAELRDRYRLATVWCVGALFEYYTPGVRRHAPLWMRRHGLEWVFRLSQEPLRLGRRYLLGNVEFLLRTRKLL